jgi:DnaJ-class molecular chaperone
MSKRDYYEVLEIDRNASADDIKKAFRKKAVKLHPDKDGGDETKFKELNEAYEVLGNESKKKAYDQYGHGANANQAGGGGFSDSMNWQDFSSEGGFSGFNVEFGEGFGGFGDIFENIFSGFGGGRARAVEIQIAIDFMEAINGCEKEINLMLMDRTTNTRNSEKIKLSIPAGIDNGQSIMVHGKGEKGKDGQRGDLYVQVMVREDKRFERRGSNIISKSDIDIATAILGGEINVDTVQGSVRVRVPAGTQSESVIKITGKGAPLVNKKGSKGDHLILIKVLIPKKVSKKQADLIKEFSKEKSRKFF